MSQVYFVLSLFLTPAMLHFASGRSNSSGEHKVRKMLLDDYDPTVLPKKGFSPVNVEFGLRVNRLVKVDSKEQQMTIDTWVIMRWNNTFFSWDEHEYGIQRVHFLPSEVWFPDIALYNNGDTETARAGGRTKFLSNVAIENDGLNVWSGPATFTATCELQLDYWPFDTQECDFRFGSFSYNHKLLAITAFATKSVKGDRFVSNGNWLINDVAVREGETDHGNCCPYEFAEITYTVKMSRRSTYQMFYLVAPCILLSILTLMSFWIPSESGERIGFVTTLLLSMMVFLLVIPSSLPESSTAIPTLGVLLMCTLVLISFVLLSTILVLRVFYATGTPPKCLSWLSKPTEKNSNDTVEAFVLEKQKPSVASLRAVQPFQEPVVVNTSADQANTASPSWQGIACRLDTLFFCFYLVVYVVLYAVLLTSKA